jgi:hypothetical protein
MVQRVLIAQTDITLASTIFVCQSILCVKISIKMEPALPVTQVILSAALFALSRKDKTLTVKATLKEDFVINATVAISTTKPRDFAKA